MRTLIHRLLTACAVPRSVPYLRRIRERAFTPPACSNN
jgi:hypothetical protein